MIELRNVDSINYMNVMDEESVDLLLTDPPYNISQKNNFKTMGRSSLDFGEWDKGFDLVDWINVTPRIIKKGGTIIIFNAWRNLGAIATALEMNGFVVKDLIRWEKTNPMPRNRDRRYIVDYEFAIVAIKKGEKWTFNRQSETYDRSEMKYPVVSGVKRIHPTQKPVELMAELIKRHSNVGGGSLRPLYGKWFNGISGGRKQQKLYRM